MNITGYNLETLRKKIRDLQEENNKLIKWNYKYINKSNLYNISVIIKRKRCMMW